jgi:DNA repair protein RadC
MRAKLVTYGAKIFDTYELLEMLLYSVIPLKDTNPIAKSLLASAGSLDKLLSLDEEKLCEMDGVGERTARLLHLVGSADSVGSISAALRPRYTFDDYTMAGSFFVKHLREERELMATMLFFDNSMRLLGMRNVSGTRFGSAETRASVFIDTALSSGATIALLGFTHRGVLACPYDSDIATCKMLYDELIAVGVTLMECFLVSDHEFTTVGQQIKFNSMPSPEVERFCATRLPQLRQFGETFKVDDSLSDDEVKLLARPSQDMTLN